MMGKSVNLYLINFEAKRLRNSVFWGDNNVDEDACCDYFNTLDAQAEIIKELFPNKTIPISSCSVLVKTNLSIDLLLERIKVLDDIGVIVSNFDRAQYKVDTQALRLTEHLISK